MKHAIILAHPDSRSFNATIAATYARAAADLGHAVVVRDLYAIDFDPRLRRTELPWVKDYAPGEDVRRERALIGDADVFVFVYPLWFNAPPAILKGYVDRVFGAGFGFQPMAGISDPLLVGRRLVSFSSSGAPESWVRETGAFEALTRNFDRHLSDMCGLRVLGHVQFGGVTPGMTKEAVNACLDRVRETVTREFGPGRAP